MAGCCIKIVFLLKWSPKGAFLRNDSRYIISFLKNSQLYLKYYSRVDMPTDLARPLGQLLGIRKDWQTFECF